MTYYGERERIEIPRQSPFPNEDDVGIEDD
jgi:hypothetical protein